MSDRDFAAHQAGNESEAPVFRIAVAPGRRAGQSAPGPWLWLLLGCAVGLVSACSKDKAPSPTPGASAAASEAVTKALKGSELEKTDLKLGFIKLTDCAPLVIAKEKGYFAEEGLNVEVEAQANWKLILDRVIRADPKTS